MQGDVCGGMSSRSAPHCGEDNSPYAGIRSLFEEHGLLIFILTKENNRMGKTKDLFKKIRDVNGIFHPKRGTIKDRNSMDLTEGKDIKKRCQEYTGELYKKDHHDPDKHNGVITHPEPDTLECEVKWALGSITRNKASGGDEFQLSYFNS